MKLYPLKFKPILKSVIWGGSEICKFKNISPYQKSIGESWEVSAVKGFVSVVDNGEFKGMSLKDIISEAEGALVGNHVYSLFGNDFPLLIKFIDASQDLSVQVHPNDELARERHNSFGKTEMWYVIKASATASVYSGFKQQITADEYVEKVKNGSFNDTLQRYDVSAGDLFFLPSGRVHAIGAGCFVAEIQQTSDITYRIYDYNRIDAQGKTRELHTEEAKDAIDYKVYDRYDTNYNEEENGVSSLVSCPYFETNLISSSLFVSRDYSLLDSFVVLICIDGNVIVKDNKGNLLSLVQGESLLIPADTDKVDIEPSVNSKLLETYIP